MPNRFTDAKGPPAYTNALHKHSMAGDETVLPAGVYYIGLGDQFDDDRRLVRIATRQHRQLTVITARRAS